MSAPVSTIDARSPLEKSLDAALADAQACLAGGEGQRALHTMQEAARAAPHNAAVQAALGVALRFNAMIEDAAGAFSRALALQPGRADAAVYLGMIRLAQGRQAEGWPLYMARWRNPNWVEKLRYPEKDLWQGKVAPGTRLLLWGEQGFGDTLQFCRYAPWLLRLMKTQGATLALEVPAPLQSLFRATWPFMDIFVAGETRGNFDAHLPLMDLPSRWGNLVGDGGLPYLPFPAPYLSALPDPVAAQRGATSMPAGGNGELLRVGIAWQGRLTHPDDRWRSLPPGQLQSLFNVPGIRWVSLQKSEAPGGAGGHPAWLPDDMAQCRDFADTARIVDGLDLVISIDSAVAHLAGALGKPVWLLLPMVADWRWQLQGDATPWYPDMRLYRQAQREGWPRLLARVAEDLAILAKSRSQV